MRYKICKNPYGIARFSILYLRILYLFDKPEFENTQHSPASRLIVPRAVGAPNKKGSLSHKDVYKFRQRCCFLCRFVL